MQTVVDQLYQNLTHPIQELANKKDIQVKVSAHYLDFINSDRIIRTNIKHLIYSYDIVNSFDYYFSAVTPTEFNEFKLVDYSLGKYHDVTHFDLMPVFFPSFSEPIVTTQQYLSFANLKPGFNVLDLGSYAGLTSILFKELVGSAGRVIAIDADNQNIYAAQKNLKLYKKLTGNNIDLIYGALWGHCNGLDFSSEGNMGSSAIDIVGQRGNKVKVKSYTLTRLAEVTDLSSIDFIKCDIEGAENVIFEDGLFFEKNRPRIIIETHLVNGVDTTEKVIHDLKTFGYECRKIHQTGVTLPLVECYP